MLSVYRKFISVALQQHPLIGKYTRTALGATESVAWEYVKDINSLLERLHQEQVQTIAVEQVEGAESLGHFSPEKGVTLCSYFW